MQLDDTPGAWPGNARVVQPDRVVLTPPAHPQQQQYVSEQLQRAASPQTPHSAGATSASTSTSQRVVQDTPARSKRRKQRQAAAASPPQQQQDQGQHQRQQGVPFEQTVRRAPLKYQPCGKRDAVQVAASVSQRLRQGLQVMIPAGGGMQLVRNTAMLSSARSILLSRDGSRGLVFQPSLSHKAAAAAARGRTTAAAAAASSLPQQQQQQWQQYQQLGVGAGGVAQQGPHPQLQAGGANAADRTSSSNGTSSSGRNHHAAGREHGSSSGGSNSSSSSKGVMLLVSAVPERQLRRFDQHPLIVARSTRATALAAAMFARLCKQGFTSVRAAGPEATRLAVLAAAEARSKLVGCGLDLAVVPSMELVDVDSLAGPEGPPQYVEVEAFEGQEGPGPGEELPKQFVRVTVLHLVRCEPQQPWQLLPLPVPAEQLPAARHAQQPQQDHQHPQATVQLQQQQPQPPQQQDEDVLVSCGADSTMHQQQELPVMQQQVLGAAERATLLLQEQHQQLLQYSQLSPAAFTASGDALRMAASRSGQPGTNGTGALQDGPPVASEHLGAAIASVASAEGLDASSVAGSSVLLSLSPGQSPAAGWVGAAGASEEFLAAGEELDMLQLQPDTATPTTGQVGSCSSLAARQPGGLLLQHKHSKKGSRQLVAAAQASGAAPAGGRGSS